MKKFILIIMFIAVASIGFCDTYVNGYYRSDGRYVQPYYRTSPNSTVTDNYSTKGNYNPYTGQFGTKTPAYPGATPIDNPYSQYKKAYNYYGN